MVSHAGAVGAPVVKEYHGIWGWLTTVDHKRIAVLYGVSAFAFFLLGGLEALLIRLQLALPDGKVLTSDQYSQLFTMHGTTMIFLMVMPMSAAFFNLLVPLQIGARDVAFPRLNAFSYWVFLAGGLLMNSSFFFGGGPDQGWFGYAPLTSRQFSPEARVDFWAIGLQLLGVASLAAGFNFIVTILNMRAPGMTLMRMPVFTWMAFIVNWLLVLAMPVIAVALILLTFDRNFDTGFFLVAKGGDPILWQHLFWIFGHPEVYILILPAMGIVSDVLPVFSRKPLFGYAFIVYSGVAIAVLGFGVWAHHMFAVGMGPIADSAFTLSTMLIAVPTGVKIFNWIGTMWGGSIRYTTSMLFAVAFIFQFIIGGLSGVMHASPPADLQQTDTYFIVAHFHYVLMAGAIFGLFAGFFFWFPKFTGKLLDEGLGKMSFWLMFLGTNITFFPMHFVGLNGQPRRTYTYSSGYGWETMNLIETFGAFVLALGVLIFVINVFKTVRSQQSVGPNPWDAPTLEWAIPSPPPEYNFAVIPHVHSREPLWEDRHPGHRPSAKELETRKMNETHHDAHALHIHLPNPSYWPLVAAFGLGLLGSGFMFGFVLSGIGLVILLGGIYNWALEPAS